VSSRLPDGQFKFVLGQTTIGAAVGNYPELRKELNEKAANSEKGYLLAWDPVAQKEAFRVPYPFPGSGGVLTTAGNLLVQGTINKTLAIYRADNGAKLWEYPVQSVPAAGVTTYSIRGQAVHRSERRLEQRHRREAEHARETVLVQRGEAAGVRARRQGQASAAGRCGRD